MPTLLISHSACLDHVAPPGHPERPERLKAILERLENEEFASLRRMEAPRATARQIARAHDVPYMERLLGQVPRRDGEFARLDPDTFLSSGSGEAALRAAGAAALGVDEVMSGRARNAFCAVRPPGHHATPDRAMGFCLFNNAAIAARHARAAHGAERVAVVDFDVHHGNGTQEMFWNEPALFYASVHQWPAYPGSGRESETGAGDHICNVTLAPGATGAMFREAVESIVLPRLEAFGPDLIVTSAGFDAHELDPLADLRLGEADFGWITAQIAEAASRLCAGRIVSTLEGGYHLAALAASAAAHVRALMQA